MLGEEACLENSIRMNEKKIEG